MNKNKPIIMDNNKRIKEIDREIELLNTQFVALNEKLVSLTNEKEKLTTKDIDLAVKVGDYIALSSRDDGDYDKYMKVKNIVVRFPDINLCGPSYSIGVRDEFFLYIEKDDIEIINFNEQNNKDVISIISKQEFDCKLDFTMKAANKLF